MWQMWQWGQMCMQVIVSRIIGYITHFDYDMAKREIQNTFDWNLWWKCDVMTLSENFITWMNVAHWNSDDNFSPSAAQFLFIHPEFHFYTIANA